MPRFLAHKHQEFKTAASIRAAADADGLISGISVEFLLLEHVAWLIYGDRWQTSAAKNIGVTARTVRRWSEGIGGPSVQDLDRFYKFARDHASDLLMVVRDFRGESPS